MKEMFPVRIRAASSSSSKASHFLSGIDLTISGRFVDQDDLRLLVPDTTIASFRRMYELFTMRLLQRNIVLTTLHRSGPFFRL